MLNSSSQRFLQSLSKCALKKYENPDVLRMIALLSGLKRFMHSIFQFFKTLLLLDELSHNNVLYNLYFRQWICLAFNRRGHEQHKAKLTLLWRVK